tara:strand:+ start:40825 stop:41061 length:237 start_codon:yes stop_codon:yes gene_type:complete
MQNGKGDKAISNYSKEFRDGYDGINWGPITLKNLITVDEDGNEKPLVVETKGITKEQIKEIRKRAREAGENFLEQMKE